MAAELELKAVVPDLAALRARLLAAGARLTFRGLMQDRRYDMQGVLLARDEVLRVRRFIGADGTDQAELTWKGRTSQSEGGYKLREEITCRVISEEDAPDRILRALGYTVSQAIDRQVEMYQLSGAILRIERYPRMDVLLEVEGAPPAIELAIQASGISRDVFTSEILAAFVARYDARGGPRAAIALADLGGAAPEWDHR